MRSVCGSRKEKKARGGAWNPLEAVVFAGTVGVCFFVWLRGVPDNPLFGSVVLGGAMGVAVLAGLRKRFSGIVCVVAGSVPALAVVYAMDGSVAAAESFESAIPGWILLSGMIGGIAAFAAFGALARIWLEMRLCSSTIGEARLMRKIFDALPVGMRVASEGGETIYENRLWAEWGRGLEEGAESFSVNGPGPHGEGRGMVDSGETSGDTMKGPETCAGGVRQRGLNVVDAVGNERRLIQLALQVYVDSADALGTLSLLIDETKFRDYEKKMRLSEERLRSALAKAEMGFWEMFPGDGGIFRDPSWYGILGFEKTSWREVRGFWEDRLHPDDRERVVQTFDTRRDAKTGAGEVDYRIRRSGGEYIWVRDRFEMRTDPENGATGWLLGTMQDISERKETELALKRARDRAESANEAKGHFIATISHEIRTPLNAIIGLSSFLSESGLNKEQTDLAETIHSSGRNLLLLVNDLLDFSKIEAGRLNLEVQEFPVRLCFEECVKLFRAQAEERHVAFRISLEPELPDFALGDMDRLRQVVQNLLSNALKFTNEGEVEVRARRAALEEVPSEHRPDPSEPVGFLDRADHEYLEVAVEDSGMGIPEERRHLLFQAFSQVDPSSTRKHGGAGLGLVICKRLVDAMGGRIWFESEEGSGTTFRFVVRTKFFRSREASAGAEDESGAERIAERHPCDILVVGGEEDMRPLLRSCRNLGYVPHHTTDYDRKGEALRRRHYNLVFVGLGDFEGALGLARDIQTANGAERPEAVIGLAPPGGNFSRKSCELAGILELVSATDTATMREVILRALSVRG